MFDKPLVIGRDGMIWVPNQVDNEEVIAQITQFCDTVKIPEGMSTYEITSFSIWSAMAKGITIDGILEVLDRYTFNTIPEDLIKRIRNDAAMYSVFQLTIMDAKLVLKAKTSKWIRTLLEDTFVQQLHPYQLSESQLAFDMAVRSTLKSKLYEMGCFVVDETVEQGRRHYFRLKEGTMPGARFFMHPFQHDAVKAYLKYARKVRGGTILMPPNSGKTLVALSILEKLALSCLILVEDEYSATRWKLEIIEKTDIASSKIEVIENTRPFELKSITICPYSLVGERFAQLDTGDWGMIIYDDAHRLPAETYKNSVDLQSELKLALASTLAREDNQGATVFGMIGPRVYEISSKTLEQKHYVRPIQCIEIMVPFEQRFVSNTPYSFSDSSEKGSVLHTILQQFDRKQVLVHNYLQEMSETYGNRCRAPSIIGTDIGADEWKQAVAAFNDRRIPALFVTKVAERMPIYVADIVVNLSYHGGSAREEYMRLGKLMHTELRNNHVKGYFISLVHRGTPEEKYYDERRTFIVRRGYRYLILDMEAFQEGGDMFELS